MRASARRRRRAGQHLVESPEQLAAIRQVRQRVVLGHVAQLLRALLHALLQVRLVRLHGALGVGQLRRHVIERLRQLLDLARATGMHAGRQVAGRELAGAGGEAPDRVRDRPRRHQQRQQREQHALEGGATDRLLRVLDSMLRAGRGRDEGAPGGGLDVFADVRRQAVALGRKAGLALLDVDIELQGLPSPAHGCVEVFELHREPVPARRSRELRLVRTERATQNGFAAGRSVGEPAPTGELARDVVPRGFDGTRQFRDRGPRHHAVADDDTRAACTVDPPIERRVRLLEGRDRVPALVLHREQPEAFRLVRRDLAQQVTYDSRIGAMAQVDGFSRRSGQALGGNHRGGPVLACVGPEVGEHGAVERREAVAEVAHGARQRLEFVLHPGEVGRRLMCAAQRDPGRDREGADDEGEP